MPQTLPKDCITAAQFTQTMERIWDGDLSDLYPTWHDANNVAKHYGFRKDRNGWRGTGAERHAGYLYTFPDGSRVFVVKDGSGIEPARPVSR